MERGSILKDLQFWTLVTVILGGIFNYIFVTRLSNELINTEKQVKMTLDIASFIKDIQPNLQIDAGGIKYTSETRFDMYINNLGAHVATIEEPPLYLAAEPIISADNINNQLREGTDYQIKNMKIGNVPPGQKVQQKFEIKFKNIAKIPDRIYYYTTLGCQTDWAVIKVAQSVLRDYLTKEEVHKLTARSYIRCGGLR